MTALERPLMIIDTDDQAVHETLLDEAARIAISRNFKFTITNSVVLAEYILRLPIDRFKDGVKVEHVVELFERCKAKHKDPLLKKLAEADRLFFGINNNYEQNERMALQLYEELSEHLPEARWMCLVVYHGHYCDCEDPKEQRLHAKKVAALSKEQLLAEKYTPIGLYCASIVKEIFGSPVYLRKKLHAAYKLVGNWFPLRINIHETENIVSCERCKHSFYEKYAIQCGFFKSPFCSVECQMARFVQVHLDGKGIDYIPLEIDIRDFPRVIDSIDYLDLEDPKRLVDHFKVKSLLKPENQAYLKMSVAKKSFEKCAILMRDPLKEFGNHPRRPSLETAIRCVWAQTAFLLGYFQKETIHPCFNVLLANCAFLLQSGILANLDESLAKEIADDVSTIANLAITYAGNNPPVMVFFFCLPSFLVDPSPA